ncbi:hypothetical protein [Deinococcus sp.]|uniref:hypothetical protein n=1 Tax=Deinococcus sp. TaxID=47478 RepID=UPI0028698903|nr:hypothetical protein [Deinococcus sp.]
MHDLSGALVGLKGRQLGAVKHNCFEMPDGNGNPPWYVLDALGVSSALLWVEGELNAMVSALVVAQGSG